LIILILFLVVSCVRIRFIAGHLYVIYCELLSWTNIPLYFVFVFGTVNSTSIKIDVSRVHHENHVTPPLKPFLSLLIFIGFPFCGQWLSQCQHQEKAIYWWKTLEWVWMTGIVKDFVCRRKYLFWYCLLFNLNAFFLYRFTQIQKKSKPVIEDELIRKHRILSFNMERRPEVAASLLMSQVCFNSSLNCCTYKYFTYTFLL